MFVDRDVVSKKSGKIKSEYKHDHVHANLDVDFNFAGPTIFGAVVFGWVSCSIFLSNLIKMYLVPSVREPDRLGNTVSTQLKQLNSSRVMSK